MEITINIPKNDYVQPTEVREDVVQMICDYIIDGIKKGIWVEDTYTLHLYRKNETYQLYASMSNGKMMGFDSQKRSALEQIRIRTSEMEAVFEVLQKAGYYIFGSMLLDNGRYDYVFTKKPTIGTRYAKKATFGVFID